MQFANRKSKTLLIISQTFVPDPASVGQHMADVAVEMARRGHRVLVYTSARGYENPSIKYPSRETLHGVEIRRFPLASFGKRRLRVRAVGMLSFLIQALWVCLTTRNLGGIFFSTSPPLVGIAAVIARWIRHVPVAYWAMDLNPDQLIAMHSIRAGSLAARILETGNRWILRESSLVVALDRFMADRLRQRVPGLDQRLVVMPPWPHEEHLAPLPHDQNPFRAKHGLTDKFVIMYSGNHSNANPLHTLLKAAHRFKDDPSLRFLFVGGGLQKKEVEQYARANHLTNVVLLPYQPLSDLRYSLSAADVHVVSLGSDMVGIVHPCKIYGAMTVGRPILFFGPRPSHVADILDVYDIGRQVVHGDVDGAVAAIRFFLNASPRNLAEMGQTAQQVLTRRFTQAHLCGMFCDHLERALRLQAAPTEPGNPADEKRNTHVAAAR